MTGAKPRKEPSPIVSPLVTGVLPDRIGLRAVLVAALAAISAYDPSLAFAIAPGVAIVVVLTGTVLHLRVTATVICAALLLLWVTLSMVWTVLPDPAISFLTWVFLVMTLLAALDFIQTRKQLRFVAVGYLAGAFLAVGRISLIDAQAPSGTRNTLVDYLNINYIGYALATGFALVVLLWASGRRRFWNRLALAATGLALIAGVEITETRGAYLALACIALWVVIWALARIKTVIPIVVLICIAAFAIVTGIADQASLAFETGSRATGDWSGRLMIWPLARQAWADHPFQGLGPGGFRATNGLGVSAHNAILEIGATLGAVGVVLFVSLLWAALRGGTRKVPARQRALILGTYLAASAPAYLSGVWELAPAAWIALAIYGRLDALTIGDPIREKDAVPSSLTVHPPPSEPSHSSVP